jgi:hypothetical protein
MIQRSHCLLHYVRTVHYFRCDGDTRLKRRVSIHGPEDKILLFRDNKKQQQHSNNIFFSVSLTPDFIKLCS